MAAPPTNSVLESRISGDGLRASPPLPFPAAAALPPTGAAGAAGAPGAARPPAFPLAFPLAFPSLGHIDFFGFAGSAPGCAAAAACAAARAAACAASSAARCSGIDVGAGSGPSEKSNTVMVHGPVLLTIGGGITGARSPAATASGGFSGTDGIPAALGAGGSYTLSGSAAGTAGTPAAGAAGASAGPGAAAPSPRAAPPSGAPPERSLHGPLLRHHSPSVITDTPPRPRRLLRVRRPPTEPPSA